MACLDWLFSKAHPYPRLRNLVDSETFETLMGVIILLNCVTIALEVEPFRYAQRYEA